MQKKIYKKGKGEVKLAITILSVLVIFGFLSGMIAMPAIFKKGGGSLSLAASGSPPPIDDSLCGTAKTTTLTLSVENVGNGTAIEQFDMGVRIKNLQTGGVTAGTDTSSGSYSLTCGASYEISGLSSSGASGDAAEFVSIKSGNGQINAGKVLFTAQEPAQTLIIGGRQHDNIEIRSYDLINDNYQLEANSNDRLAYQTDGANFSGISDNNTVTAVGAAGELKVRYEFRPLLEDTVYGDVGGFYILVDAPTATWNVPTVKLNGVVLSSIKDQLTSDEKIAYANYEYAYKSTSEVYRTAQASMEFDVFAKSGVNPAITTDDIQIDFASVGAYASVTNSNNVKTGAVDDSISQAQVHTLIDTMIPVS
jgi:hypothetical protein